MKTRIIYVGGKEDCPADQLMADFRRALDQNKYAKSIEFSPSCLRFFSERADIYNETDDNVYIFYAEIPEEDLPPLELKMRKDGGKYFLQYLKEYGDEPTHIQGKSRKGKNQGTNEKIVIIKKDFPEEEAEK